MKACRTQYSYRDGVLGRIAGKLLMTVFLTLIFPASACLSGNGPEAASAEPSSGAAVMEWEGAESEITEPRAGVIVGAEDWEALWKKAFGKKAPEVDFNRFAVACVFLGHYPGWWYRIGFGEPEVSGSTLNISFSLADLVVELEDRGKGGMFREYGARGQYKMRLVEKKQGFPIKLQQVGKPQVPLRKAFDDLSGIRGTGS